MRAPPHRAVLATTAFVVLLLVPSFLATAMASSLPPGGGWPSFTYDYSNSRYQAASTVNSSNVGTLTRAWTVSTDSSISSTPVVQNGSVYFADWAGDVYSVNVSNGQVLWEDHFGYAISSSLALAAGLVYVAGGPNGPTNVTALYQTNGTKAWSTVLHTRMNGIWASPTVYNGRLFVGVALASAAKENNASYVGELDALNATNGQFLWNFVTAVGGEGGVGVWGSVSVDPALNAIYFGTGNAYSQSPNSLYAYSIVSLNASSGKLNWYWQAYKSHKVGGDKDFGSTPNLFTLTINGTTHQAIGLGSKDGTYYILDRTTGAFLEKAKVGDYTNGGIRGSAGFVYPAPGDPEVIIPTNFKTATACCSYVAALLPAASSVAWSVDINPGTLQGSVALVPGAVFVGDSKGNLYALNITSGAQLFHTRLPYGIYSGITVAEGHVLVGNFDKNLGTHPQLGLYAFVPAE